PPRSSVAPARPGLRCCRELRESLDPLPSRAPRKGPPLPRATLPGAPPRDDADRSRPADLRAAAYCRAVHEPFEQCPEPADGARASIAPKRLERLPPAQRSAGESFRTRRSWTRGCPSLTAPEGQGLPFSL